MGGKGERVYFVHSFYAEPSDPAHVIGEADYGVRFPCIVREGSVVGTQFHPEKSAEVGGRLTVETLDAIEAGQVEPRPQPEAGASLAPKVTGEEARLDFGRPARRLADAVRAFTPAPGAWTTHRGRRLKVSRAALAGPGEPGEGTGRLDPGRYGAWRKLQAEAHRQLLRVDARARAEEKARLRSFHRAIREQPNRLR